MATLARNPLSMRPHAQHQSVAISPYMSITRKPVAVKRAHSPEPSRGDDTTQSSKRFKPVAESPGPSNHREELKREQRERKRAEREQEFKTKYRRAFPGWVFYFDLDNPNSDIGSIRDKLEKRVLYMGARVEDFFSKDITHLITLDAEEADKENSTQTTLPVYPGSLLGSPIRLKGRGVNDAPVTASDHLVKKAIAFGIKVWSVAKLDNVLDRCDVPTRFDTTVTAPSHSGASASKTRALYRLLEDERVHGTTTERDPTQKRHDYTYFSKGCYFVLVEDMRQELATIAALEYPVTKGRDGRERPSWPVLHCHPSARGPFVPYDENEERRRERADRLELEREQERERRKAKLKEQERRRRTRALQQAKQHDLRRSVSMNNLNRRTSYPDQGFDGFVDLDADAVDMESANASGYLASGAYMAASGNSVGITSTVGTTSTASIPFRSLQLPVGLRGRLQQQVVTSRKFANGTEGKENRMGPPLTIPNRHALRKSRSTNTMRLPLREEGVKPGYCESCRVKFDDFIQHIESRKHRKFALDDSNFVQLDYVLSRVKRRTLEEVAAEKRMWASRYTSGASDADDILDDDATMLPSHDPMPEDDVRWDDWVDADEF